MLCLMFVYMMCECSLQIYCYLRNNIVFIFRLFLWCVSAVYRSCYSIYNFFFQTIICYVWTKELFYVCLQIYCYQRNNIVFIFRLLSAVYRSCYPIYNIFFQTIIICYVLTKEVFLWCVSAVYRVGEAAIANI